MEYYKNDEVEHINTECRDLDGDDILIENPDGYGGCDITVGHQTMRWRDLDQLKLAIAEAERRWRNTQ